MERTLEDLLKRSRRALQDPQKVAEIAVAALGSPTRAYDMVFESTKDKQLAQDWRGLLMLCRDQGKYGADFEEVLASIFSDRGEEQIQQGEKEVEGENAQNLREKRWWRDEQGELVECITFFSTLFKDEESRKLDDEIVSFRNINKELFNFQRFLAEDYTDGFFGKAEVENLVEIILSISAFYRRIVGLSKMELESFVKLRGVHYYIDGLIREGYLREKWVEGTLVVFPTKKMLEKFQFSK